MELSLPTRVQAQGPEGPWEEMTAAGDISFGGLSFVLKHNVQVGHVLRLDVPLPKTFRQYSLSEPSYHVYALVRDVIPMKNGVRVGAMFLGRTPPKGYAENPGGVYLLPTDPKPPPKDRRQHRRFEIFLNFRLRRAAGGEDRSEEQTVAENVGKGGARILTSLSLAKGEVVIVEELGGSFSTRAEIKNVYIGKDNIPRLNLHFLDTPMPDRLIPAS